jgi:hypothetical protein
MSLSNENFYPTKTQLQKGKKKKSKKLNESSQGFYFTQEDPGR